MIIDYNNLEANYDDVTRVLLSLKSESKSYEEFEYRVKEDYEDGLTARLWKHVANQYNKDYIGQLPIDDRNDWTRFIDYMIEHSSFLNKNIKTRCRKNFDRLAFYNM